MLEALEREEREWRTFQVLSKLMTDTRPQVQEAQLSKIITNHLLPYSTPRPPPRYIIVKLQKTEDNKKILKDTGRGGGGVDNYLLIEEQV